MSMILNVSFLVEWYLRLELNKQVWLAPGMIQKGQIAVWSRMALSPS